MILFSNWIWKLCRNFAQVTGAKVVFSVFFSKISQNTTWELGRQNPNVGPCLWDLKRQSSTCFVGVSEWGRLRRNTKQPVFPVMPILPAPREQVHVFFSWSSSQLPFSRLDPCCQQSSSSPLHAPLPKKLHRAWRQPGMPHHGPQLQGRRLNYVLRKTASYPFPGHCSLQTLRKAPVSTLTYERR